MNSDDNMKLIQEVIKSYETADEFSRTVALYREAAAIPANNELRYAGHHALQALDHDGRATDEAELTKARNHCQRAMYEAAEAGLTRAIKDVHSFQCDYHKVVVSSVVSDYANIVALAREAQDILARGRGERESVEAHTHEYIKLFKKLRHGVRVLEGSRDDLNALMQRELKDEQDKRRRFVIQIVTRIIIGLASIVIGYLALGR